MTVFDSPDYADHERVVFCRDSGAGLKAIIALHDTTLGPAAGGCRMWPYASIEQALSDVLRLSEAMTDKNALAGLALGGGKAVIIGDPATDKSPALLRAFARQVQGLNGAYYTAEDIGIGLADVERIAADTDYVFGLASKGAGSGDPSPFTARGGLHGIRAAAKHKLGSDDLAGLRVAVQGVGNVGRQLCRLLQEAGVKLVICDIDEPAAAAAAKEFAAEIVGVDEIYDQAVEIFAPCAMGGVINDATIDRLKARIVAGVANNQLAAPRHGAMLFERGILYAPDFVVNAGGMHNASCDIFGDYDKQRVIDKIDRIYDLTLEIFRRADEAGRPPHEVAIDMAKRIIRDAKERREGQAR